MGGFLTFSVLGFMATNQGVDVKDVVQSGECDSAPFAHNIPTSCCIFAISPMNCRDGGCTDDREIKGHIFSFALTRSLSKIYVD